MVLFEEINGENIYYAGNDCGILLNAKIVAHMVRGRTCVLHTRLYYAEQAGEGAFMW